MQFEELVRLSVGVFDAEIVASLSANHRNDWSGLTACDAAEFIYLAALTPSVADLESLKADLRQGADAIPTEFGDPLGEDIVQALTYLLEDSSRPLRAINSIDFDSSMRIATLDMRSADSVYYANRLQPSQRMSSRPLRIYAPWFYTIATKVSRITELKSC